MIGIGVVVAVVVVGLIAAFALGAFSPKGSGGPSSASQGAAQASSQASSANSASATANSASAAGSSASAAGSASASASAAKSTSASSAASAAASDARKQAIDDAFAQGYQVFEGTLRVLSAEDLAALQGVDPRVAGGDDGTYAVLVFDAQIQVSGMSGDGSGSRRQGATMLRVAEQTQYSSSGDLGTWSAYDGQHLAVAAMANDIWFPSDVSMPVGEPRTAKAIVLG